MADIEKLKQALIAADAAGNQEDAARLAQAIRAGSAQAPTQPQEAPQAPQENYTGAILPFSRDETGTHFDSDAGLLGILKSAATLPGDVYTGKTDPSSDEAIIRSLEMAGIATPMGPASRLAQPRGTLKFDRQVKPQTPSAEALKTAAKGQYDDLTKSGLEYSLSSVDDLSRSIQDDLAREGLGDVGSPQTYATLRALQKAPEGAQSVPFGTGLHPAIKQLGRVKSIDSPDPVSAKIARNRIMEFLEDGGDAGIVSGPSGAGTKLKTANKNYAGAKRSEMLQGLDYASTLRAKAANSGGNKANKTRGRLASLLSNKGSARDRSGFSPEEIAQMEGIVEGSVGANTARAVGNRLGGGGGLGSNVASMMGVGVGGAAGGIPGAVAGGLATGAAGSLARRLSERLTQKAFNQVDDATRKRTPLYDELLKAAPTEQLEIETQEAILKYLIENGLVQPGAKSKASQQNYDLLV